MIHHIVEIRDDMLDINVTNQVAFSDFIATFKKAVHTAFHERDNIDEFIQKRGFPALVLREIMATTPLAVSIPSEYGGRGCHVKECLGLLEAASYESLPLTLTFGINIALFLEPVAKYGQEEIKEDIFRRFLEKQNMGGLMITEPDYGSDALNMQTTNVKNDNSYHIRGTKHWQGLTGLADYWIMTSRNKNAEGKLGRDIDLFIVDEQQSEQRIIVEEYYNTLGLYPIPYGKNKVDILVPERQKLIPETTGLKLMIDTLHRSRYQFAGMGMGFLKRMLDEAIKHCTQRYVGGKPLIALDQVKYQISTMQSAYTVCSGMCYRAAEYSSINNNLAGDIVEANSIKAYLTDLMQQSAQTLTQLSGGNGYKLENIGGRGILDSRPFQIFEGSNEMLYTQVGEMILKLMKRSKTTNLFEFLSTYDLTKRAVKRFKQPINISISSPLPQRQIVDLGKVIARIIISGQVVALGDEGYRPDLINDCMKNIMHEISALMCLYTNHNDISPIEDYQSESAWLDYA